MAAESRLVRAAALIVAMASAALGLYYLGSAHRHGGLASLYFAEAAVLLVVSLSGWKTREILVAVGGVHFLLLGSAQLLLWERPVRGLVPLAFGLALVLSLGVRLAKGRSESHPPSSHGVDR